MNKLFLSISVLISATAFAQKQVEVKLYLRDGNTISGTTTMNDVVLKTNYGQLAIPIQKVSSVVVGIGKDKTVTDKANSYLKILNSNASDDVKSAAYEDVIKLGMKAISAIQEFQEDPKNALDIELTGEYTIDNAMSELKSSFNIDNLFRIDDVISIDNEYTIGGSYEFSKLDIKTDYGTLSVPKEKIKNFDASYLEPNTNNELTIKLLANKHISGNENGGWFKTGISLKKGQKFTISASGVVTLASLSGQRYKPDGSTGDMSSGSNAVVAEYSSTSTYPSYGNVVYKIGDDSETTAAGAKFSGTAKEGGMLYISIYETVYSQANTGFYTVKVNLK